MCACNAHTTACHFGSSNSLSFSGFGRALRRKGRELPECVHSINHKLTHDTNHKPNTTPQHKTDHP